MGTLRYFNLQPLMESYGCRTLFETGTGIGDGVRYAAFYAFDAIYTVEIHPDIAATARERFIDDPRVQVLNETSEAALARVLPRIPAERPVLFWLDAHFPGADFGLAGYRDERDPDLRLPLARELDLIARLRGPCRDVILIDDLRIYEDGPYEMGNLPDFAQTLPPDLRNIDFVTRGPWARTHEMQRFREHTGYLVLTPRRP
ncbi:MAG: hypothetical protein J0L91_12620 [Burkholderiales bacterium]|nr:hypothetical protein [Burkholderiales bacterium]MCC7114724.1 hypothetical protein [Burkholderiales bacterium]